MLIYDPEEELADAFMHKTPLIVVEGVDDVPIYYRIAAKANLNPEIVAAEIYFDIDEGCEAVIEFTKQLQHQLTSNAELLNYFLAIIDCDTRYYRNTIPNLTGIFILRYYSIESHFVTRNHTKELIRLLTNAPSAKIINQDIDFVETPFVNLLELLYYSSLEALKNSMIDTYTSLIGFSESIIRVINDSQLKDLILLKKQELDEFAENYNLSLDREVLKHISKGKWLLDIYVKGIVKGIKSLQTYCGQHRLQSCDCCKSGKPNKCMFKMSKGFQEQAIKAILLQHIDIEEITYIIDEFNKLAQ